jgi:hypothetical protein
MAAAAGLGVDASVQELLRVISGFLDDDVRVERAGVAFFAAWGSEMETIHSRLPDVVVATFAAVFACF